MFKIAVIFILLFILYSLGVALFAFVKEGQNSEKMLKALTYRIGLSIALIVFLMAGAQFGLIAPHGM